MDSAMRERLHFLLLNIGLFIPMGWGAPSGELLLTRHSVQIVPDVSGEVIDVPIQPNVPIKANDVLFRIDPAPFKAQVDALDAQLKFAELRREQFTTLQRGDAGLHPCDVRGAPCIVLIPGVISARTSVHGTSTAHRAPRTSHCLHSIVNHCTSTRRLATESVPAGSSQPRPTTSMRLGST